MIRILKSWDWSKDTPPPLAYAKRAVRSAMTDKWRRGRTRPTEDFATGEELEAFPAPGMVHETIVDPALRRAIGSLPSRHRRLIESVYFLGLSLDEFAEQEKLAKQTVYNYHHQALKELAGKLFRKLVRTS